MWRPRPVRVRSSSAARIAVTEYTPVKRSDTATPTFCGSQPGVPSFSPVTLISPPVAWMAKS